MVKDLFDDSYFEKHRNRSEWEGLEKRGLSGLNIKNKPKIREIAPLPQVDTKIEEDEFDFSEPKLAPSSSGYRSLVAAGFAGGFLVLLAFQLHVLTQSLTSLGFWLRMIVFLVFLGMFMFLFEIPYRLLNK